MSAPVQSRATNTANATASRRLIVTGDDFGWSPRVNDAICQAYDAGVLTSASLMVAAPAAEAAARLARERPGLAIGLHAALVHAPPLLPPAELPHLTDERGWLLANPRRAGAILTFSTAARAEMRAELEAQFQRTLDWGLPLGHVDAHLHFTLTPVFFRELVRLCEAHDCRRLRIPLDDWALYRRQEPLDAWRQAPLAAAFAFFCREQQKELAARGFTTVRRCLGLFRTGRLSAAYLADTLQRLPPGDYELHCHPGADSDPADGGDLAALLDPRFREAIERGGFELSTYRDLEATARPEP